MFAIVYFFDIGKHSHDVAVHELDNVTFAPAVVEESFDQIGISRDVVDFEWGT